MEGTKIEYKRWKVKDAIDGIHNSINEILGLAVKESGIEGIHDFEVAQNAVKSIKDLGSAVKEYEEQVNYQTQVLEGLYREVVDMNRRLEKLEEEVNKD